ncbi:MAG: zinc ABC transporter substrate-binding protein [Verrucomicrobiota bacterium]
MTRLITTLSLLAAAAFSFSCSETNALPADGKPQVFVSVPPYLGLVEAIGGDLIEARSLVTADKDPHTYSPTPQDVVALSKSHLYFTAEMPFEEPLLSKLGRKGPKVYSLTENMELLEGNCDHGDHSDDEHGHDHEDHDHGHHHHHDHDHHHHEMDPHVWLSPELLAQQAEQIAGILKNTLAEEHTETIETNLKAFTQRLSETDQALKAQMEPLKGHHFYVYHGAFAYFAQHYGMQQMAIEVNGRRPEPKELAALIKQAKEEQVKLIFVQPQFDQSGAKTVAEAIGGKVIPVDPLEQDVIANLKKIADALTSK